MTLAQSHARKALNAPSSTSASNEYELAASQFATAAKETANPEAFRTLKLLEQQHEHLAQLLKFQTTHPVTQPSEATAEPKVVAQAPALTVEQKPVESPSHRLQPPNPLSNHLPQREISSSIASNLASARGIPSNRQRRSAPASPLLPQHADNKISSPPKRTKSGEPASKASGAPSSGSPPSSYNQFSSPKPQVTASAKPAPSQHSSDPEEPDPPTASRSDEPFQRFYATFESLFSKLSAPLAFAGLPLNLDDHPPSSPTPTPAAHNKFEEQRPTAADPDLSKIFSKATLRALRDEHGGPATGGPFGGAESFYVVPTTGGTISYADILTRAQQEATRHNNNNASADPNSNSNDQLEDEFVDARETPQPASPVLSRGRPKPGTKTMEELQLENEYLRSIVDNISRRLAEFEMGAQTSSLALQRSIRAMQAPVAAAGAGGAEIPGGGGDRKDGRVSALEEQLAEIKKEAERMGRENEKLRGVVGRYRERWEKLKEGARVRREVTGDGGS